MKVSPVMLAARSSRNLDILREYAEFWKIPYSTAEDGTAATIHSGPCPPNTDDSVRLILSPSSWEEAKGVAEKFGQRVTIKTGLLRLPVSKTASAAIKTTVYSFDGPRLESMISAGETTILSQIAGTKIFLLSIDMVSDYCRLFLNRLDDPPSRRFVIATKLPFSYKTVPGFVRNRAFRSSLREEDINEANIGPVEFLRTVFLACLAVVAESPIPRIWFWRRGRSNALVVTHDVETREGLRHGHRVLSNIEKKFGIRSTWNVPSSRYPLASEDLRNIVLDGELGAHDTSHDGRLALLNVEEAAERLIECRRTLEQKAGVPVSGFRSPLLQHSRTLFAAAAKAGFRFDSSIPSWEPLSPTSLRDHGAGTVFPFTVQGLLVVPVSLPQDHQLIRVMGLTPGKAADQLTKVGLWIQSMGGASVLLVHPDYEFASSNPGEYEVVLKGLISPTCDLMTLGELADWWMYRQSARIYVDRGEVKLTAGSNGDHSDLELQFVEGYGEEGFELVKVQ